MKLTLITPALAAVLGLALASAPVTVKAQATNAAPATAPATASTGTSTAAKASAKKTSKYTQYAGTITAIDATSVTVKTSSAELKLTLDATTQYLVAKKKAAATDFAVNDAVTGSYSKGADGSLTAHSVHKKK